MRTTVTVSAFRLASATALGCALLLAGCASKPSSSLTIFDLGVPAPMSQPATGVPAAGAPASLIVIDATGPAPLDGERMLYRLEYADALQARTYANSRWSSTPLDMVTRRIKTRLAQAGIKVLSATDASTGVPIVRLDVDDFAQTFTSASQSHGRLLLRASVFNDHRLIDQRSFASNSPAPSADAAGGARALSDSTDRVAAELLAWLATLELPRQ